MYYNITPFYPHLRTNISDRCNLTGFKLCFTYHGQVSIRAHVSEEAILALCLDEEGELRVAARVYDVLGVAHLQRCILLELHAHLDLRAWK